jgi:3-hydroxy acid dehydrogenase / malonic semialdehyde reductase
MTQGGRTVLITGASSGIGQACAEAFAAAGERLILCARRLDRLQALADRLQESYATECHIISFDVRDASAVEGAIASLPDSWHAIDILLNNAGLSRGLDPLQEGLLSDWQEMLDTNVQGLLLMSRAILPGMVARGSGQVINIGSIAGHEVYPKGAVYCASKHAVAALTKGMRLDLNGTGVRVSTVDPGLVETEFSQVRFHGDQERAAATYTGMTPLTGADVAETVLWVASQPAHVNVAEVLLLPSDQASATLVARK